MPKAFIVNKPEGKAPDKPIPKEEKVEGTGYKTALEEFIATRFQLVEEKIKQLNNITNLIVTVLFVGFITLLFSLFAIIMQWYGFSSNTQSELIKAIDKETEVVNSLTETVEKIEKQLQPTPTVTSIPTP